MFRAQCVSSFNNHSILKDNTHFVVYIAKPVDSELSPSRKIIKVARSAEGSKTAEEKCLLVVVAKHDTAPPVLYLVPCSLLNFHNGGDENNTPPFGTTGQVLTVYTLFISNPSQRR